MHVDRIYFDMDGVLADFGRGIRELCGMEPSVQGSPDKRHDDMMFDAIRKVDHFYMKLKPLDEVVSIFEELNDEFGKKIEVLSAIPKPERGILHAREDKIDWIREYVSDDAVVNIVLRKEKRDYAKGKGYILIDDTERNIEEWEEAGGTGILFTDAKSLYRSLLDLGIMSQISPKTKIERYSRQFLLRIAEGVLYDGIEDKPFSDDAVGRLISEIVSSLRELFAKNGFDLRTGCRILVNTIYLQNHMADILRICAHMDNDMDSQLLRRIGITAEKILMATPVNGPFRYMLMIDSFEHCGISEGKSRELISDLFNKAEECVRFLEDYDVLYSGFRTDWGALGSDIGILIKKNESGSNGE